MTSNGTRKPTKGWDSGPSGETALGSNNVVVIEEPTVPAMAAMDEAARAEVARAEADRAQAARTEVSGPPAEAARPRRSTLETFNDEMAVLERPLEGDVEYVDEKPPRRWPQRLGLFVGAVALVGIAGSLVMSRHKAAVARVDQMPPAAAVASAPIAEAQLAAVVPAALPAAPPPEPAVAVAPAEADDDAEADDQAETEAAAWKAPSRSEWTKVRTQTKVTSAKHARAGGGKVVYRRTVTTTVKHRHVVKRTVSGRRDR
ncbi:MAG TPA: hypothetical protein VIF57_16235 [Polyangia bacterium]